MPDEPKKLFRKRALDRMSSPDRLDRSLAVTSARGWIAMLTILAITIALGVWSVVGEVSTYVEAHGFLLNRGGKVVDAVAAGRGRLSTIAVAVGDEIERDTVVALIVNDELDARYASALALIEERRQALEALKAAVAEESRVARANGIRRRQHLDELEATALEMLEIARTHLENSKQLYEQQVIARVSLERSQQELNQARSTLLDLSRERDTLEANEIRRDNENAARIREMTSRVQAAERQAREVEALVAAEKIQAPVSGQVIELKATPGTIMGPGQAVVSIRTGATALEALLYVPPSEGKQVEVGMQALVAPVTVRREEFGAIKGTVESLSEFPASLEGMVSVLQNQSLARSFSDEGPPYAGRIVLLPDPTTESGFAWTSPKGASQKLTAGTLASVEIKTRSQPPITLAIPLLKELMGLR